MLRRASKNYIVTLEERIRLLEGTLKSNIPPAGELPWTGVGEKEPEARSPMSIRYRSDDLLQVAPAELPSLHAQHDRRWSQTPYSEMQPLMATASTLLQFSASTKEAEASLQSPGDNSAIQLSNESAVEPSTIDQPVERPLQTDSSIRPPQRTDISTLIEHGEPDVTTPSRIDEGRVTRSYPSPLSTSTEPLHRPDSPSYEEDRQVKEKVRLRCFGPTWFVTLS
jgi:hypothetical protein